MTDSDIKILMRSVCDMIEEKFRGTLAEFENFASPRAYFLKKGYAHMEVFNVPETEKIALEQFVDDITIDKFYPNNLALCVLAWTQEETAEHFQKDVNYINQLRESIGQGLQIEIGINTWTTLTEKIGQLDKTKLFAFKIPLLDSINVTTLSIRESLIVSETPWKAPVFEETYNEKLLRKAA